MSFNISRKPLEKRNMKRGLNFPHSGALVVFEGRVRKYRGQHIVANLEYKAIGISTKRVGQTIINETKRKFDIINARCVHRVGKLNVGEMTIWIGVAAIHRKEAFQCCSYIIEQLKKRLPILKKEYYAKDN